MGRVQKDLGLNLEFRSKLLCTMSSQRGFKIVATTLNHRFLDLQVAHLNATRCLVNVIYYILFFQVGS